MTTINLGNLTINNSQILNFSTDEIKASVKKFLETEFLNKNILKTKEKIDCTFNETDFRKTLKEIKSGEAFKNAKPIDDLIYKMNIV